MKVGKNNSWFLSNKIINLNMFLSLVCKIINSKLSIIINKQLIIIATLSI